MFKSIKKLFSVDESELDFEDFEEGENKAKLYQDELAQTNEKMNPNDIAPIVAKNEPDDNRYTEVPLNQGIDEIVQANQTESVLKQPEAVKPEVFTEDTSKISDISQVLVTEDIQPSYEQTNRRSFDFEKEINATYDKTEKVKLDEEESKRKEKLDALKEVNESKEDYVLKDIISPMRGVIRKETNTIKKEEPHRSSQIIKLREQLKTTAVEDTEDTYTEIVELPTKKATDTKDLADTLSNLEKSAPKDTLSETSKFTLIEDSTGEMRLVIDEDE